jgi:hypothetical protein
VSAEAWANGEARRGAAKRKPMLPCDAFLVRLRASTWSLNPVRTATGLLDHGCRLLRPCSCDMTHILCAWLSDSMPVVEAHG